MDITKTRLQAYLISSLICLAILLLLALFSGGLIQMLGRWQEAEYSHGYLIPIIAVYLILQKLPSLVEHIPAHGWTALPFLLLGLSMLLLGELSTLFTIIQYGFVVALTGIMVAVVGLNGVSRILGPVSYLLFMIPLPHFIQSDLSGRLQLFSSDLGVWVMRLINISVFLEGNVIDLGGYRLQVVEACSGLRYLFPLMSFGFLFAAMYQAPGWQRVVVFLSTIPISILMNSVRIAVTGMMITFWGNAAVKGFLHDLEGWFVFLGCLAILMLVTCFLQKFNPASENGFNQARLNWSGLDTCLAKIIANIPRRALISCNLLLLAATPVVFTLPQRTEVLPAPYPLVQFPLDYKHWRGNEGRLAPEIVSSLKLSDYFIADFIKQDHHFPVNLYIAYYDSQRKGASVHSPRSCLPGGGWRMLGIDKVPLDMRHPTSSSRLYFNRAVIQKGAERSLVYYWFQQRGRIMTNEYVVKWYLFWDALTRNRSDGALVRLTLQLTENMTEVDADAYMKAFLVDFYPLFETYLPR